jgi:hypothetical protein
MRRIRNEFKYDSKATVISTPLTEVFEKRHGVCQDFAHVMIAGLRGLGLPAAYVSGYLRTIPPPGKPRLQGADATHAWVSVGAAAISAGWLIPPTIMIANDHIVLAMGRDFPMSPGRRHRRLAQTMTARGVNVMPVGRVGGGDGPLAQVVPAKGRPNRSFALSTRLTVRP